MQIQVQGLADILIDLINMLYPQKTQEKVDNDAWKMQYIFMFIFTFIFIYCLLSVYLLKGITKFIK